MVEKEHLFLTVDAKVIYVEEMMELENYHLASILLIISGKNRHNLKSVSKNMMRSKIFIKYLHKTLMDFHGKYNREAWPTTLQSSD